MFRRGNTVLLLAVVTASWPIFASEQDSSPAALTARLVDQNNRASSLSAFLGLRKTLRSGSPEGIKAVQDALCQQLMSDIDRSTTPLVCLALAAAPPDGAFVILVNRLQPDSASETLLITCGSLANLASQRPPLDAKVTEQAVSRLSAIALDRKASAPLIDSAAVALSCFGSAGFDALMNLQDKLGTPSRVGNAFYTNIAVTGDARALPVLRAAIADEKTTEGNRIQAVRAIGEMFFTARRRGLTIESTERTLCWQVVYPCLADESPDQLFGVALKTLVNIEPTQPDLNVLAVIDASLLAGTDIRKEAALDALFAANWDARPFTLNLVRACASPETCDSVRETARAVLSRCGHGEEVEEPDPIVLQDAHQGG